ncbi:MAG: hypothetical protein ACR2LQ_01315 [Acidimicrobiales bacterium]
MLARYAWLVLIGLGATLRRAERVREREGDEERGADQVAGAGVDDVAPGWPVVASSGHIEGTRFGLARFHVAMDALRDLLAA